MIKNGILIYNNFVFPANVALTQDRPDIVLVSETLRRVVLVELTLPCEENFEFWHHKKQEKDIPIKAQAGTKGWGVNIFAVEVEPQGFSANSTLRRLGFGSKDCRTITKALADIAMKASFAIYLSRESRVWDPIPLIEKQCKAYVAIQSPPRPATMNIPSFGSSRSQVTSTPMSTTNVLPTARKTSPREAVTIETSRVSVVFRNKGNVCYASSLLPTVSSIPEFWGHMSSSGVRKNGVVSSFLAILCKAQVKKESVDHFSFLEALQNSYRKVQPASEVVQHLLAEIHVVCLPAYQRIFVSVVSTITCNTCDESSINEQNESILSLPLGANLQQCLNNYLAPVQLTASEWNWMCPFCNAVRDATKYNHFANASDVLVIQLKRFAVAHDLSIHKSFARVDIHQPLQLQIAERNPFSEILINRNYSLSSYISHTGTLDRGHYCAHVKVNNK